VRKNNRLSRNFETIDTIYIDCSPALPRKVHDRNGFISGYPNEGFWQHKQWQYSSKIFRIIWIVCWNNWRKWKLNKKTWCDFTQYGFRICHKYWQLSWVRLTNRKNVCKWVSLVLLIVRVTPCSEFDFCFLNYSSTLHLILILVCETKKSGKVCDKYLYLNKK